MVVLSPEACCANSSRTASGEDIDNSRTAVEEGLGHPAVDGIAKPVIHDIGRKATFAPLKIEASR